MRTDGRNHLSQFSRRGLCGLLAISLLATGLAPSAVAQPAEPTAEVASLVYLGDDVMERGSRARAAGILREQGGPIADREITFTLSPSGESCTDTTDAAGQASCRLNVDAPTGRGRITADFDGGDGFSAASDETRVTIYALPSSGGFLIGDRDASVGSDIYFWGARWERRNELSGGQAPGALKGFAQRFDPDMRCDAEWSTRPGTSPRPPTEVPSLMAVAVTRKAVKRGDEISGSVARLVVIDVDSGYASNAGGEGTGKVIERIDCERPNTAPVAGDDQATTDEGQPVDIVVLDNDFDAEANLDPGSVTVVTAPGSGTTVYDASSGTVTYTPDAGFSGQDSFVYRVCDSEGLCDEASVTITVEARPEPTPTPTPSPSGSPTPSPSPSEEPSPTPEPTPTEEPSPSLSPTSPPTPEPTMTIVPSPSPSPTPSPSSLDAPPVDPTVATDIYDSTRFLYQGAEAVQTGLGPAIVDAHRVAVVRGQVVDRAGAPISGVGISIVDHPDFGGTLTRADGFFDMVVNGGGRLTIAYQKDGLLPVHREIEVPWQDFSTAPQVTMLGYDPAVTTIDLSSAEPIQVARGSEVQDSDGWRRATLLFSEGTTATMELPDGSTQPLSSLEVRATEYTVGASGEQAMPADLPPTSAYTYAVELSVDQAVSAGATEVHFSKPVAFYLDNFIGIPVGVAVPSGFYDRTDSVWKAEDDGLVVKIVGEGPEGADLDVDGDGQADEASSLTAVGITAAERQQLAQLYEAGKELWRVPIDHFSPFDFNFARFISTFAESPDFGVPTGDPATPCELGGNSVIGCESQMLSEDVSIAGSPFTLHYSSMRVPGRKAHLRIRLTRSNPPPDLRVIHLRIEVAGQLYERVFEPRANLVHDFIWDGRDAYGRMIQGDQTARVDIGYEYPVFYATPGSGPSFARPGGAGLVIGRLSRSSTLWQSYSTIIGALRDTGLQAIGGWTLSGHHAWDPTAGGTIYGGNGRTRRAAAMNPSIGTFAGNGADTGDREGTYTGDGGRASQAGLSRIQGIALGRDGSLFIADTDNGVVRKVAPDGTISTVAGGGSTEPGSGSSASASELVAPTDVTIAPDGSLYIADPGAALVYRVVLATGSISIVAGGGFPSDDLGDGGPATEARLDTPRGVAVSPGGTLLIGDSRAGRVRAVWPDGRITTYAGGGSRLGDEGPATQARLKNPSDLVVTPTGVLLIADAGQRRIRQVDTSGVITTVAGTGVPGSSGDGGLATSARLSRPSTIAIGPDSSIYVAERSKSRVRKISASGFITTIAGTGKGGFSGASGPPVAARLGHPQGLAVGPDSKLYIADTGNYRVRRIDPALPGYSLSDLLVASGDGAIYHFDRNGRHLRTLDAMTGNVIHTFGYTDGRLTTISDDFGNVTTIAYDGSGNPIKITAPFGQESLLTTGPSGYLTRVEDPAGDTVSMTYKAGNLLESFTSPSGTALMDYDEVGRLVSDDGADGASIDLARNELDDGYEMTTTTAEGRVTRYRYRELESGEIVRSVIQPSGATATSTRGLDGSVSLIAPDGTRTITRIGPDPRFGMQAPIATSVTVTMPSGKTSSVTMARAVTMTDPANILSLSTQTDTVTSANRNYTKTYDAATDTITTISPEGRRSSAILDPKGLVVKSQEGDLEPVMYGYDTRGRPEIVTQGTGADARVTSMTYGGDGFVASVTDPEHTVSFTRDEVGRITSTTLPDTNTIGASYDGSGNLTSLTPPGRPAHAFTYTQANQRKTYDPPASSQGPSPTNYDYDWDRAPISIDLPGPRSIGLGYDAAGRLDTTTFSRGVIDYGYDPLTSQLTSVTAPDQMSTSFNYDGSLLKAITSQDGAVSYDYDSDLRVSSRSINGANPVTYGYDRDGLLKTAGPLTLSWDQQTARLTSTTASSTTTSQTYDSFGELDTWGAAHSGSSLYSTDVTRDKLGRITTRTETIAGVTTITGYTYDARGRLTDVTTDGVVTEHYAYDANGNRIAAEVRGEAVTATYDDQDRLLTYGDETFTYNPEGQMTSKTTPTGLTTYDYDELGNLLKVETEDGTVIAYRVDAMGRRVSRSVNGAVTNRWLYGTGIHPIAELDASGNVISSFVYGSRGHVPDVMAKGGVTYRLVTDHLGSVRLVVNSSTGAIVQRIDYDSFGQVISDINPGFQPFGYAGGVYDEETSLVRFGARDYDPAIGRWTTKDPIDFHAGSQNLYAYVEADPVNLIDPFGLWSTCVCTFLEDRDATLTTGPLTADLRYVWVEVIKDDNHYHYSVDVRTTASISGMQGVESSARAFVADVRTSSGLTRALYPYQREVYRIPGPDLGREYRRTLIEGEGRPESIVLKLTSLTDNGAEGLGAPVLNFSPLNDIELDLTCA